MPLSTTFLHGKIEQLRCKHAHAGDFCFFADMTNVDRIVRRGALLSRKKAESEGLIACDCASSAVLLGTPGWVADFVRLYFAPATPMLYQVEGIKRAQDEWPECPQPVYFAFKPEILLIAGVKVSDGNMGSYSTISADASDEVFEGLPFDAIYHRGAFEPGSDQGREIVRCRHAEVLIPNELPLTNLAKIVFRSQAEANLGARRGTTKLGVPNVVEPTWFNCHRLHMHDMTENPGTGKQSFIFRNAAIGDDVMQLCRSTDGQLRAFRSLFTATGFSALQEISGTALPFDVPADGVRRVYLRGHLVAELQ